MQFLQRLRYRHTTFVTRFGSRKAAGLSRATATASGRARRLESDDHDQEPETIVLSDRVRARLGLPQKDTRPLVLDDDPEEITATPRKKLDVATPQGDILELRGSRPITGELVEIDYAALQLAPRSAKIQSADYIKSSLKVRDWPSATMPEIAVIGRSNVGKSSLINMLTGRKELALVSKTPGKTRAINHFLINKNWYLVDLPGYGYAKQSKENRFTWGKFTQQFFVERSTLIQVLLLIDATVPTQDLDLSCAQWLMDNGVPFSIVYTKMDKRKKRCPNPTENIASFQGALRQFMPTDPAEIATSASEGKGRDELLRYLAALRAHVGYK